MNGDGTVALIYEVSGYTLTSRVREWCGVRLKSDPKSFCWESHESNLNPD